MPNIATVYMKDKTSFSSLIYTYYISLDVLAECLLLLHRLVLH
jgi:hypothetical protein